MEKLAGMLKNYLLVLEEGEIAYRRLDKGMFSVLWGLYYYFGEDLEDSEGIIVSGSNGPDVQEMKFE